MVILRLVGINWLVGMHPLAAPDSEENFNINDGAILVWGVKGTNSWFFKTTNNNQHFHTLIHASLNNSATTYFVTGLEEQKSLHTLLQAVLKKAWKKLMSKGGMSVVANSNH